MQTKAGVNLGHYQILRTLGRGGEGSVFLGKHCMTEQLWALKIVPASDENGFHELDMVKRLRHPSLPRVIDVFRCDQVWVLVMEYIQGMTLADLTKGDRRLNYDQVIDTAGQLCSVLHYLHSRRHPVVHLDLKPSNLILDRRGRLYLTDFGSAMHPGDERGMIRKGTAGYAAPEQYHPDETLDFRSDIFGLGAVLYRLISGKKYSRIMLGSRIPGCPEGLEKVLKKCLATDPDDRFNNVSDVWAALRKLDTGKKSERKRVRVWAAVWIGIIACYLAADGMLCQIRNRAEVEREYQEILSEALILADDEALELYREAIFQYPRRKEAWLQYIAWKDRDGILTENEDMELRRLLHTIPLGGSATYEEELMEDPEAYGIVAGNIAIMYWYNYQNEDAKRIAQGWFQKSADAASRLKQPCDWGIISSVYRRIGSYYDSFLSAGGMRNGEDMAFAYWEDTGEILQAGPDSVLGPDKLLLFYESCATRIVMDAGKLYLGGIGKGEMEQRIARIEEGVHKIADKGAAGKTGVSGVTETLQEARAAVESLKDKAVN